MTNFIPQGNSWKTRELGWHRILGPTGDSALPASPITPGSNALYCLPALRHHLKSMSWKLTWISKSLSGFIEQGEGTPTEVIIDNLSKKFLVILNSRKLKNLSDFIGENCKSWKRASPNLEEASERHQKFAESHETVFDLPLNMTWFVWKG